MVATALSRSDSNIIIFSADDNGHEACLNENEAEHEASLNENKVERSLDPRTGSSGEQAKTVSYTENNIIYT